MRDQILRGGSWHDFQAFARADYRAGSRPSSRYDSFGFRLARDVDLYPVLPLRVAPNLPTDDATRKATPLATGVLDYFPLALLEVARVSQAGNDQHNPGKPLHWDKTKSKGHADSLARHLVDRGTLDVDGMRHSAKVAWRALAMLQTELEDNDDV